MTNSITLAVRPLAKSNFAPYGDVIDTEGAKSFMINNGTTERFHDLADVDVADGGGEAIISIFRGQAFRLPIKIRMLEQHPSGHRRSYPFHPAPGFLLSLLPGRMERRACRKSFLPLHIRV